MQSWAEPWPPGTKQWAGFQAKCGRRAAGPAHPRQPPTPQKWPTIDPIAGWASPQDLGVLFSLTKLCTILAPVCPWARGRKAIWPLASTKTIHIFEIRSTCMPSPAFGHQARKPWISSWVREAQVACIPMLWPHSATRAPGLSFLALPPTCSTSTHRPPSQPTANVY